MRSGTTANWTSGTGEIGKLERKPYFKVDVDFYGSANTLVTSGSLYHDDFSGTTWPSWLSYGTSGTDGPAASRGGGTAQFTTVGTSDRAYAITASSVGSPAPNSGFFVVRSKAKVAGTGNAMWLVDNWKYGSQPIPGAVASDGRDPDVYFSGGRIYALDSGGYGSVSTDPTYYHIGEAAYDGTKSWRVARGSNMGTLVWGSVAWSFETGSSYWGFVGDPRTNFGAGTLYADYFQVFKGTNLKVGNLGSGYVAQVYGSDDAVIGSAQSNAQSGTATIDISSKEYPLFGYYKVFTGTGQGSQITREPSSGNGTFWGGDVYKVGTGSPDINDITADVTSLRYRVEFEDALTGYVPAGAISGDCDIELATGSKYSYFNRSAPYYGIARLNRDVAVDTGFDVSGTSQYLSAFRGLTSEFQTSASERGAQLKCLDYSELLRRKTISWELMHNVRSDVIIRMVLAECGIFCYPDSTFWCKFDNSLTSEQDDSETSGVAGSFATGRWGEANGALRTNVSLPRQWRPTQIDSDKIYVSYWFLQPGPNNDITVYLDINASNCLYVNCAATGNAYVGTIKNGSSTNVSTATFTLNVWNHICATWDANTDNKIYLYINGQLVDSDAWSTYRPDGTISAVRVTGGVTTLARIDQLQIGPDFLSAGVVREIFTADADDSNTIDTGLNTIEWLWVQEKDAWNLLKELMQAEGGQFYFDADGDAHFKNRHSLLNDNQISVKTISYDDELVEFNLQEDADAVINRAVVRSSPMRKQTGSDIYAANELISVPAPICSGSSLVSAGTRTIYVWYDNPAVGVDTTITATAGTGQSRFKAFRYAGIVSGSRLYEDFTGSIALTGTAYSAGMRIHISSSAYSVAADHTPAVAYPYVCSIGSAPGTSSTNPSFSDCIPYLYLWGSAITPNQYTGSRVSEFYAVAEDTDSQANYGTKAVEIENSFITNFDYADDYAKWIVMNNAQPIPRLDDVTIMADPRLEAGDRVTALDSSGNTGLQDDFWVLGIDNDFGPPWTQTLKLDYASGTARVSEAPILILDHPIQGKLDLNAPAW